MTNNGQYKYKLYYYPSQGGWGRMIIVPKTVEVNDLQSKYFDRKQPFMKFEDVQKWVLLGIDEVSVYTLPSTVTFSLGSPSSLLPITLKENVYKRWTRLRQRHRPNQKNQLFYVRRSRSTYVLLGSSWSDYSVPFHWLRRYKSIGPSITTRFSQNSGYVPPLLSVIQ